MRVEDRNEFYPRMPFYMMYPAGNMYLSEMEYERDLDRMRSYFPAETEKIMQLIEKELDELDYEGSRIYDEEPDRFMIQEEIQKIYRQVQDTVEPDHRMEDTDLKQTYFAMVPLSISGSRSHGGSERGCGDNWLCSMVGVLFGMELYKRRCHHRRCRRWF